MTGVCATLDRVAVSFTRHANDRLRERFPGMTSEDVGAILLAALAEGRWSGRKPEGFSSGWREQPRPDRVRYAWNPEETVCVVYARHRNRHTRARDHVVVTVLARLTDDEVAWAAEWRREAGPMMRKGCRRAR